MRLDEILAAQKIFEMAYSQKKAESVITGLETPLNNHLLKIWMMPHSEHHDHWLTETLNWCDQISEIILKPSGRRPKAAFYFRILYDEPFGDAEIPNINSRLRQIQRMGYTLNTTLSPLKLVDRLKKFHIEFSEKCEKSQIPDDELRLMIEQ